MGGLTTRLQWAAVRKDLGVCVFKLAINYLAQIYSKTRLLQPQSDERPPARGKQDLPLSRRFARERVELANDLGRKLLIICFWELLD